jgi:hypothetical protein
MKMTMTMAWKKKKTQADPTAANARISRGKDTFFTMPALFTTTPVQVPQQQSGEEVDDEVRHLVVEEDGEHEEVDRQRHGRSDHGPHQAEDGVLVLDLDLGADEVDQQLTGEPDLAQPLAHADGGRDDARDRTAPGVARAGARHLGGHG